MKYKTYAQYDNISNHLNIYIIAILENGARKICTSLDKLEFTDINEGDLMPVTLSLNRFIAEPFLKGIANALKDIGIKADGEPILENELSAIKYHLEDMRKLVFKRGK